MDCNKVKEHRLILLSSGEDYLRRQALTDIIEHAKKEHPDLAVEKLVASEKPVKEWFAQAFNQSLFASNKIIVVRNVARVDEPGEALNALIQQIPSSVQMILVVDLEQGNDSKQKRLEQGSKKWADRVKSNKGLILKFDVVAAKAKQVLKDEAHRHGKDIGPGAITKLLELTSNNLSLALEEIQKLTLLVHPAKEIGIYDIEQVVSPSLEWSVFTMVDMAFTGNSAGALKQLRILLNSDDNLQEAAYVRIMPIVSRQLKLLWQARVCIELKDRPADEINEYLLAKPNFRQEADWSQSRLLQKARNLSFDMLTNCLAVLADADAKLKGILPAYHTQEILEQMLLELSLIAAPAKVAGGVK